MTGMFLCKYFHNLAGEMGGGVTFKEDLQTFVNIFHGFGVFFLVSSLSGYLHFVSIFP